MTAFAIKVEIAFDSGFSTAAVDRTWTNVSDYAYGQVPIGWGRQDQFGQVEPTTCSVTLDNTDGRFTPDNASSPYYPNVRLDRPLRVTITPAGGSPSKRFTGYVDSWLVSWPSSTDLSSTVQVPATSRTGRLALRNTLRSSLAEQSIAAGDIAGVWPLDDPSGSVTAEDVSEAAAPLRSVGGGAPVTFTDNGAEFAGGAYLAGLDAFNQGTYPDISVACSFLTTTPGGTLAGPLNVSSAGTLSTLSDSVGTTFGVNDGVLHRAVWTRAASGAVKVYLDGVEVASTTRLTYAFRFYVGKGLTGTVADVAVWAAALSPTDVAADFAAFNGGIGDTTDERFEAYASYAGIPTAEVDADAGATTMGPTDTDGLAVLDALRVVESTEGGIVFDDRDGTLRLQGRRVRYHSTPEAIFSMVAQEIDGDFSPRLDRSTLHNEVTATNAATSIGAIEGGGTKSVRVRDDDSCDEYGTRASSIEVNSTVDGEPYAAASWRVANNSQPTLRAPALSVDLLPLELAKIEDVLALGISSRITVEDQPAQAASSSVDYFIEGGNETWSPDTARLSFNVSPIGLADSVIIIDDPARGLIDAGQFIGY